MGILQYWQIITTIVTIAIGIGIYIAKVKAQKAEVESLKAIQIGMSGRIDQNREDSIRQDERLKFLEKAQESADDELKIIDAKIDLKIGGVYTAIKDLTKEMHDGHKNLSDQMLEVIKNSKG
jgi:hypothetical protein